MDPSVERTFRYRELLGRDLPLAARCTLEWLLVNATRELASLEPHACPDDRNQAPRLIAVADEAVAEAVRLMGSQFGNIQLYLAPQDTLCLLAYRNFPVAFASRFAAFTPDRRTTCSRVVASGRRVVVEDIEKDEAFAPHVPAALSAGFRSLQSTPLKHPSGVVIGVLTTHFATPRSFANDELEQFDAHAKLVSAEFARACG